MKLVGIELGRIVMLYSPEEVRPNKGVNIATALEQIQHRYQFLKAPDLQRPTADLNREGYRFELGQCEFQKESVVISDCTIYRDGISVSAFATDHADAFLNDLTSWMQEAFGFRNFVREPTRLFLSQVVVEFEQPLSQAISAFQVISSRIATAMNERFKINLPVNLIRLDFGWDRQKLPSSLNIANFVIDRRAGVSFERERYFCEAPLPTSTHIQILQDIENQIA